MEMISNFDRATRHENLDSEIRDVQGMTWHWSARETNRL
jgi:hypothetical protein